MTRYMVRVELPGKQPGDYEHLHKSMGRAGYFRVIEGRKGWWHLPHAEYTCLADGWTSERIRDEVLTLARSHHRKARVFACVANAAAWTNLRPVTDDDPAPDDA